MDATTGELATGGNAGSLDVTENLFASPYFGNYGFIDRADTGSGMYAADVGNTSDWALQIRDSGYGNIPVSDLDSPAFSARFPAPHQQQPYRLTISASAAWERT